MALRLPFESFMSLPSCQIQGILTEMEHTSSENIELFWNILKETSSKIYFCGLALPKQTSDPLPNLRAFLKKGHSAFNTYTHKCCGISSSGPELPLRLGYMSPMYYIPRHHRIVLPEKVWELGPTNNRYCNAWQPAHFLEKNFVLSRFHGTLLESYRTLATVSGLWFTQFLRNTSIRAPLWRGPGA